jgi:EF-P beta-lysylation protein EpmB
VPLPSQLSSSNEDWQHQLRNVISSQSELLGILGLLPEQVGLAQGACDDFPLKVPRSFVQRMRAGDPHDPLLLQVLASELELIEAPGWVRDPVGETGPSNPHPGIIHKYHGRVLLVVSGGCAVNCRYCFRRHFPYGENQNNRQQWLEALQYIRRDESIEEVILSGGDPLVATDEYLGHLVREIAEIAHVKRLRIHSRLPVVIPDRITDQLLAAITHNSLQTIMVIHCNHAREIDSSMRLALSALRDAHITTLNQAVLLANINDSAQAQVDLCNSLFAAGVLPYYLHLLDKVQGAAHFDVPEKRAQELLAKVAARLPGYMVPKLVREVAGADAKVNVPVAEQATF